MSSIQKLTSLINDRENITKAIEEELKPHLEMWLAFRSSQNPEAEIYHSEFTYSHMDHENVFYRVRNSKKGTLSLPLTFVEDRKEYFNSMPCEALNEVAQNVENKIENVIRLRESLMNTLESINRDIAECNSSLI